MKIVRFLASAAAIGPVLVAGLGLAQEAPSQSIERIAPGQEAVVSELVVRPPEEAPVPKVGIGAPLLSPAEIDRIAEAAKDTVSEARSAVRTCGQSSANTMQPVSVKGVIGWAFAEERDAALKVQALAVVANKASAAALALRRKAASGGVTEAEMEKAELARQEAVNDLTLARNDLADASAAIPVMQQAITQLEPPPDRGDRSQWEMSSSSKLMSEIRFFLAKRAADRIRRPPSPFADLTLKDVVVREGEDRRGRFLSVTGKVLNTRQRAIPIPSLEIIQHDGFGFAVDRVIADGKGRQIPAGGELPFAYEFRPKASRAEKVTVTFASEPPLPPRRPAGAPIAPTQALAPPPNRSAARGMLAGDMGVRVGMLEAGSSTDCS